MKKFVEEMMRKALDWNSPHVRKIAAFIAPVANGLQKLGVELTPSTDYAHMGKPRQGAFDYRGHHYRVGYEHPHKNPRKWGALAIYRIEGREKILVRRFETLEDASVFCLHPTLDT